jgi:hypothetical protein
MLVLTKRHPIHAFFLVMSTPQVTAERCSRNRFHPLIRHSADVVDPAFGRIDQGQMAHQMTR